MIESALNSRFFSFIYFVNLKVSNSFIWGRTIQIAFHVYAYIWNKNFPLTKLVYGLWAPVGEGVCLCCCQSAGRCWGCPVQAPLALPKVTAGPSSQNGGDSPRGQAGKGRGWEELQGPAPAPCPSPSPLPCSGGRGVGNGGGDWAWKGRRKGVVLTKMSLFFLHPNLF